MTINAGLSNLKMSMNETQAQWKMYVDFSRKVACLLFKILKGYHFENRSIELLIFLLEISLSEIGQRNASYLTLVEQIERF